MFEQFCYNKRVMKIVILSDTHDNLANFKKVVGFAKKEKISHILHCGDISNPKTLKEALRGYSGRFLQFWEMLTIFINLI